MKYRAGQRLIATLAGGCMLLSLVLSTACRQQEPKRAGSVEANAAYREYFGEPPTPESGRAYARVAYLPLIDSPGVLRPVPLYLFSADDQLAAILGRLTDGELYLPPGSPLYNPLPQRTRFRITSPTDQAVTISLDLPKTVSANLRAIARVLTETAGQDERVERVIVRVNGRPVDGMPDGGFTPDRDRIVPPAAPELILIAGIWEPGVTTPAELVVSFDRPVRVESFSLRHADGSRVAGEYYTSIFRMAVVVHPEQPGQFDPGDLFQIEWDVVDAMDRTGSGRDVLALRRFDHREHPGGFEKNERK